MSVHACAATGCDRRTPWTWCVVHSPQRADYGHRRHPVPPHEPDGAEMKRYDDATCTTCQGRIFRRTCDGQPKGKWLHLHEKDWIYAPHVATPARATSEAR